MESLINAVKKRIALREKREKLEAQLEMIKEEIKKLSEIECLYKNNLDVLKISLAESIIYTRGDRSLHLLPAQL